MVGRLVVLIGDGALLCMLEESVMMAYCASKPSSYSIDCARLRAIQNHALPEDIQASIKLKGRRWSGPEVSASHISSRLKAGVQLNSKFSVWQWWWRAGKFY